MKKRETDSDEQEIPAHPSYQVYACGPFLVKRWDGTSYQSVPVGAWGGSHSPRLLLKVLLASPERTASRGRLLEILWPAIEPEEAARSLNDAAYRLRAVLRPTKGAESLLLTATDTSSYALVGQERLWVDADAALSLLEQADEAERQGKEALSLLDEAASLLSRGEFLADEDHLFFYGRRARIARARHGCILSQARTYGQRGKLRRGEALLSSLLEENPLDEDALCALMLNLHQQGRTSEGLRLYEETKGLLEREGLTPTEATRATEQRLRNALPIPMQQQQRTKAVTGMGQFSDTSLLSPFSLQESVTRSPFSSATPQGIMEAAYVPEGTTMDQLRRQILAQTLKGTGGALLALHDLTLGSGIAERLATALTGPQSLTERGHLLHDEEILSICSTSLPILWRLFFDGQLLAVKQILPGYISQLAILVREAEYQRRAGEFASKAHQLACMLALQEQEYGLALIHADQALFGANVAEDDGLRVSSLVRRALVYRYLKRFKPMLEAYQEAYHYRKGISSLLEGRLYTGLAEAHSKFGREYEAQHFLDLAYKTFPDNPKDDPNFAHTHFKLPQGFEAVVRLNLKQARRAWEILAKMDTSVPMAVVPDRVELSIDQAKASLLLGDMKQSCQYVAFAATSAAALGSHLRYNEAYNIYEQIRTQWPHEQRVRALAGNFHS